MGLKLNYSCDCVVDEQNGTFFNLDKKIVTCSADGKAFNVVDDAAVQCIALTATLVLGNLSGAADGVAVAADLREINVLTILVRISCCVFFLSFSFFVYSTINILNASLLLEDHFFNKNLNKINLMGKNELLKKI